MINPGLIIGIVGGIAALLLVANKVSSVANFVEKLTVTPELDGKVDMDGSNLFDKIANAFVGSGLIIPIKLKFQNRSSEEMVVSVQSVMVYYEDTLVGSNKPSENGVKIAANSTSTLRNIKMQVPLVKLKSLIGSIVETMITKGDYTAILDKIVFKIGIVYNNAFSFDLQLKLNQEGNYDTSKVNKAINGLGLVATTKRKIGSFYDYANFLPAQKPQYKDYVIRKDASVFETVDVMRQIAKADKELVRVLAKKIEGASLELTLQNIFNFVYRYIDYVRDSQTREQVRRPLRTLYDQKGDCDCYATLIGSMLEALNIPYKFRIAAYQGNFQHVYVIVPSKQMARGYYVVDPVLDKFNMEKHPTEFRDL